MPCSAEMCWVQLYPDQFCDQREKGDWDRTQKNSSYLVISVGRRPRWTIDLVREAQTKAGGVLQAYLPHVANTASVITALLSVSLSSVSAQCSRERRSFKTPQADFPLLLQSPFCCEKGSGALYLETNGSKAGRRVLPFFPYRNHTVHICFFSGLVGAVLWNETRNEYQREYLYSSCLVKICSVNLVEYLLASAIRGHKNIYFIFSRASCIFTYEFASVLSALLFLLLVFYLAGHHFTFRLLLLK